jgi:hypothetical protein
MTSYLEQVESLFLSVIRKGLSLRMSDLEIIRDWEKRGVPVDVVQRGIISGIRKFLADAEPSTPVPSGLKYYRTSVEREFDIHSRAAARGFGSAAPQRKAETTTMSLRDKANQVLAARLANAPADTKEVYARAISRFESAGPDKPLADLLFEIEDLLVTGLAQTMATERLDEIRAAVEKDIEKAVSCGVGRRAIEDLRRHGLRKAVATAVNFESFMDEVVCEYRK